MRAAGLPQGMAKRRSMWARTCEPRPSWKRPSLISWRSLASTATFIGLRANATAMADCRVMREVARAARARDGKTSCLVSAAPKPSYPSFSAATAAASTSIGVAATSAA
jgi:hypothetical protein